MYYRNRTQQPQAATFRAKESAEKLNALRVSKRLGVGQRGTARWIDRFGDKLVCVRYREDPRTGKRFTTVELIVDVREPKDDVQLLVEVKIQESGLRQRVKEHGGRWNPNRKLWQFSYASIQALGLEDRVVEKLPLVETRR